MKIQWTAAAALLCLAATATAQLACDATPTSYAMQNGECGSYCYHDQTYTGSGNANGSGSSLSGGLGQLTDGVLGGQSWGDNLGGGNSYEWVGWSGIQPVITFDFGGVRSLDRAAIYCNNGCPSVGCGGVNLFGSAVLETSADGVSWSPWTTYVTSNAQRTTPGSFWVTVDPLATGVGRYVRMTLSDGVGPWIFISEIDFVEDLIACAAPPPDLAVVPSSWTLSPVSPLTGQTTAVGITATNLGGATSSAQVDFYEGNPALGGVLIGSQTQALGFGQAAAFSASWTPATPGLRTLYAVVTNLTHVETTTANDQSLANAWVNAPVESLVVHQAEVTGWTGGTFQAAFSIENAGSAPATLAGIFASSPWVAMVNPPFGATLAPGQSVQVAAEIAIPATALGGVGVPEVYPLGVSVFTAAAGSYGGTLVARVFGAPPLTTTVTVTDQVTNAPLAGATVAVDGVVATFVTNGAGQASIPLPEGQRGFYAYKSGYVAGQTIATVSAAAPNVGVALEPGQTLSVQTIVSQPLTTQQIIDRGVVVQDPINNVVLDFVVALAVSPSAPSPAPIVLPSVEIPSAPAVGSVITFGGPYVGGAGSGGGYVAATFSYPAPNVRHETWILIPGSVWALKQFREATILVRNNATAVPASAIRFENVTAQLNLPAGLALPDLNGVSQPLTQALGTLNAGEQAQAAWVIRGDAPGSYQLTGSATGDLWLGTPGSFAAAVAASATSDPFQVELPQLRLAFQMPTQVVAGQPFQLDVSVTNEGAASAQLVRVSLKVEDLVQCSPDPAQPNPNCAPCVHPATPTIVYYDAFSNVTRLEIDLGDLPSGATAGARFSLISHVTGRIVGVETQVWNNTVASPPVEAAAEYPGTPPTAPNGGCLMLTGVNVPTSAADAAYVKTLPASPSIQTLVVRLDTTNPAFYGQALFLGADAFFPGPGFDLPPTMVPGFPGLWLGLGAITLIDGFQQNVVLTPGGRAFVFGIPPGLSGYHLLLQGLTVPPSGGYCATDAHEIVFQ